MRPIDADELLKTIEEIEKSPWARCETLPDTYKLRAIGIAEAIDMTKHFIRKAPTVTAVPVKHGKWICKFADNGWLDWYCTNCGELVWNDDIHVHVNWSYCPCCGAKMDAERREE